MNYRAKMRIPVCVLIIVGMVVCMYLLGVLATHKDRVYNEEIPRGDIVFNPETYTPPVFLPQNQEFKLSKSVSDILRQKIDCDNKYLRQRTYQRGSYWVLENFVVAQQRSVECHESVTYTTHTDYSFLDNLVPVVARWMAPVSVALFAPGDDFRNVVDSIYWMRNCLESQREMELIREFVSFHLYFNASQMPSELVGTYQETPRDPKRCLENPMQRESFKAKNQLTYPVNVGRNVAKEASATYFVFPSDIELYPVPKIVPRFLKMIARTTETEKVPKNRVFPIAIYEIREDSRIPENKTELVQMLNEGRAQRFHASICKTCHSVPMNDIWEKEKEKPEMHIFTETKRTGKYNHWEPIFIGSRDDPSYDERLSWEGKSDKMTQGYLLCVMDYTMSLLSDAFLTHRPGYKTKKEASRWDIEKETIEMIKTVIGPELDKVYGKRKDCNL